MLRSTTYSTDTTGRNTNTTFSCNDNHGDDLALEATPAADDHHILKSSSIGSPESQNKII